MNPRLSEEQTEADVPWLLVALIVFHASFGLIMIDFFAHKAWPVAMLWAGTCAIIGSTVGFLFGIPRTLQGNQEFQQNTLINSRSIEDTDGHQEASSEVRAEKIATLRITRDRH